MEIYRGKVTGVTFEPAKSNIAKVVSLLAEKGDDFRPQVKLQPDPENKYDPNAIRVLIGQDGKLYEVGWVPKSCNERVIKAGVENCKTDLVDFNTFEDNIVGFVISITKGPTYGN